MAQSYTQHCTYVVGMYPKYAIVHNKLQLQGQKSLITYTGTILHGVIIYILLIYVSMAQSYTLHCT